jgi:endoribonuclease Dicer
LLGEVRVS